MIHGEQNTVARKLNQTFHGTKNLQDTLASFTAMHSGLCLAQRYAFFFFGFMEAIFRGLFHLIHLTGSCMVFFTGYWQKM